jgi:hypothetical protein
MAPWHDWQFAARALLTAHGKTLGASAALPDTVAAAELAAPAGSPVLGI